jgi:hypothetical protein
MRLSLQDMFSGDGTDGQEITSSQASTNYIVLGTGNLPESEPLEIEINVPVGFVTTNSATLTIAVQSSADAAFTTPVTEMQSAAIAASALAINTEQWPELKLSRPSNPYVRLYYTIGTGTFSAGKIVAGLTLDRQTNKKNFIPYPV